MINVFLVISGYGVFQGGLVDTIADFNQDNEVTGTSQNLTENLPDENSGFDSIPGSSTIQSFIDGLTVIKDLAIFFVNIVAAPITMMVDAQMPNIVRVLIGIPLLVLNVISYAAFIRSGA